MGYMSIIKKNVVQERIFQNFTYSGNYLNFFDTGEKGADFAMYSPLHTHLYIVNNRKNKIMVYDITQTTIFDVKDIDAALNNTLNQNKTNTDKESTKKNQKQTSNKEMQRRVL